MAALYSNYLLKFSLNNAFKSNFRSYFRFHISSKIKETPKEKIAIIESITKERIKIPTKINREQLSSSLRYQSVVTLPVKEIVPKPKHCVLYFTHFESDANTIDKISSIYNDLGLDVMIIQPKQSHMFLPESGKSVVDDLISKLSGNNLPLNVGNFLVHSSAAGAFYYAIFTNLLASSLGSFNLNRIQGQIFDGLVLNNPSSTLSTYRSSLPKFFVLGKDIFDECARNFIENPVNVETLVFHTVDGANCDGANDLIEKWKKQNLNVCVSSWSRSANNENYLSHPKQYERTLETFLIKTGFI